MRKLSIADIKASDILSIEEKRMVIGGVNTVPFAELYCWIEPYGSGVREEITGNCETVILQGADKCFCL